MSETPGMLFDLKQEGFSNHSDGFTHRKSPQFAVGGIRATFTVHPLQASVLLSLLVSLSLMGGCAVQKDRSAARLAAMRIHSLLLRGNFATIYAESAPGFKTVSESEFVAQMNEILNKLGSIKNLKEIAYTSGFDSRVGRTHALVFDLQCDRIRARETLVLVPATNGEMQLWKLGIDPVE